MTRWLKFAGRTIDGTPILLITPLLMIAAWIASAEIYAVALQIPAHGESAALVLVGLNVVCSWLLVFCLTALVCDMHELRLPRHRQVLAVGVIFIFGFIFVAPCALVWCLNGGARDVFMIGMGSVAGTAGALLWRFRSAARNALRRAGQSRGCSAINSCSTAESPAGRTRGTGAALCAGLLAKARD